MKWLKSISNFILNGVPNKGKVWSGALLHRSWRKLHKRHYKRYVAKIGDEIVGTFALAIMDNMAHLGTPSGLIEDVVVKTDFQGKGIGK